MPVTVSLFQKQIGGRTFAFDTGDVAVADGETKEILRNVGNDIVRFTLKKREITFTIRGANAADITALYAERDNNVTQLVNANGPVAGQDITFGGDTIYSALLLDIQAGAPITVAGVPIIEQVQVIYRSQVYV